MAINNVVNRSFTSVNLVMVSLVEETEPKEFQHKYFMFFKIIPSVKADNSSGKSYDHKSGITFKMEAEKALAMAFALQQYALGKGKMYEDTFGNFVIFADGSKSQYGANSKKSLSINYYTNQKTNKTNISIFSTADQNKIPFFMTPYEASAMSDVLKILANECLRLEITGPGVVVKRQINSQQQNNNPPKTQIPQPGFNPPQPIPSPFNQPPQKTESQQMEKVANEFTSFFNYDDNDLPF